MSAFLDHSPARIEPGGGEVICKCGKAFHPEPAGRRTGTSARTCHNRHRDAMVQNERREQRRRQREGSTTP
jgi:hypothetical protein